MYIELEKGLKIRYEEYGKGNQEHILFIHGLGSSLLVWRDIPQALSDHFHILAVDLVGFGESDKPITNYTIGYFTQFIENFIRHIGIKEKDKLTLIGHSLGGYIALNYAIENKEDVHRIVLIDSSGMLEGPTILLEEYLDAALEENENLRYQKVTKVFENLLAEPYRLLPVFVNIFISIIDKPGAKHAFRSAYENSTSTCIKKERLNEIKDIPCLIIWGEKDRLIPLDYLNKFKTFLNNPKVIIINDAGHSPFVEKTAIFYHKLISFLF